MPSCPCLKDSAISILGKFGYKFRRIFTASKIRSENYTRNFHILVILTGQRKLARNFEKDFQRNGEELPQTITKDNNDEEQTTSPVQPAALAQSKQKNRTENLTVRPAVQRAAEFGGAACG